MLWLGLLGAVTVLIIALRRVARRQRPLSDELYSSRVAVDQVQSGVAWVRADGVIGSMNHSLAESLGQPPAEKRVGTHWLRMFVEDDRDRAEETYADMLIKGIASFEAFGKRPDDCICCLQVRLVAVHDHKMRFVGHHCLALDCTRERELEARLGGLQMRLEDAELSLVTAR